MRLPRLDALKLPTFGFAKPAGRRVARQKKDTQKKPEYHAVTVVSGFPSCAAVRDLDGQRFLASEAPRLPLTNCDQAECDCAYQHLSDRREAPRRDDDIGLPGLGLRPPEERRHSNDRRHRSSETTVVDYFGCATGTHKLPQLNKTPKPVK